MSMVGGWGGKSTSTVKVGKVSSLNHESGYNTMELGPSIGWFDIKIMM